MSNTPECIPAYELLKARYKPEEANVVYHLMNNDERNRVKEIADFIYENKDNITSSCYTHRSGTISTGIVRRRYPVTDNVIKYFRLLGYNVTYLCSSMVYGEDFPVFIIGI